MPERIYLDHNSTTPLRPEVLEAMLPHMTERFGNPSSLHAHGREAREAVESARDVVADAIGARPLEIVFTGGGTEADNLALDGVMRLSVRNGSNHLVTSAVEHHAVHETADALGHQGCAVTAVDVDRHARVDPATVRGACRSETALVSVMHANNEIGTIEPVAEIAAAAHAAGALFHTDAVQSVGKIPVDVDEMDADLLSLSAHKFGGPKGVGALYVRTGTQLAPLLHGGSHERNRRPGTENVAGIAGLAAALAVSVAELDAEGTRLRRLTSEFIHQMQSRLDGVVLNSPGERTPGTVSASFEGVDGETLIVGLDLAGVSVSAGSACASGAMEPSHVLSAMGVPREIALGTVRFSFGRGNTIDHAHTAVDAIKTILARAR